MLNGLQFTQTELDFINHCILFYEDNYVFIDDDYDSVIDESVCKKLRNYEKQLNK